jgi:alkylation response protein AidB-like acyl-CoA dehydrogenase
LDLRLSPEELAFRGEVTAFIDANLPAGIRRRMEQGAHLEGEDIVAWHKILHRQGWAVTNWPPEWGGKDWSPVQRYIFKERLQAAPAPEPLTYNANMIGPVLIAFGTPAQQQRFLPALTWRR